MKVAFHFNADDPSVKGKGKGRYDLTFLKRFFSSLHGADEGATAHIKIWHGDLLTWERFLTPQERQAITTDLFPSQIPLWREINVSEFLPKAFTTNVYVIVAEGMSIALRDQIHSALRSESTYYGAAQVFEVIPVHWVYYHQKLSPRYRYYQGQLRIFCMVDEEEEKDSGLEEYWAESGLFQSVIWEILGVRHTIFESRDNFQDARRLAELDRMLPAEVSVMADEILMRLRDERPQLCDTFYAACERLRAVTTRNSEEAAHSALSCRRFLKFLADFLYPPRSEEVDGHIVDDEHFINRLDAYIVDTLRDDKERARIELSELDKAVKTLNNDASKGVHAHVGATELDSIIRRLVTFTYRVLQLAPPPLTLPDEPYEEDLRMFLLKDSERGDSAPNVSGQKQP